MDKKIGERIRSLRTAKLVTQEQAAEHLGISPGKYERIENGLADVSLDILTKLSTLLGVSVENITGEGKAETTTPVENQIPSKAAEMLDIFYANKNVYECLQISHRLQHPVQGQA